MKVIGIAATAALMIASGPVIAQTTPPPLPPKASQTAVDKRAAALAKAASKRAAREAARAAKEAARAAKRAAPRTGS